MTEVSGTSMFTDFAHSQPHLEPEEEFEEEQVTVSILRSFHLVFCMKGASASTYFPVDLKFSCFFLQDLSGFDNAGDASTSGRGGEGEEGDGAARRPRKSSGSSKHGRKGSRGRSRGPQVPDEIPEVGVGIAYTIVCPLFALS